jgi:hypothetical protein
MSDIVTSTWRRFGLRFLSSGLISCLPFSASFASPKLLQALSAQPRPQSSGDNEAKARAIPPPAIRWDEQQPGCTFSSGTDGNYRYGLWSGDIGIVLAVDARELQIIRRRIGHIFGIQLTIRYRGVDSLDAGPDGITLQFMKHFKIAQTALDPDAYVQKIQSDADAFDDDTRRTVAKHPAEKQLRETRLQDYQKLANELIEFLSKNSLRPAHLDRANPEVSGWLFFDTNSKWLGGWKAQEDFVFRLPLGGQVFEFPFKLPPEKGEFLLQKRQ